jgi:hypothetical protein
MRKSEIIKWFACVVLVCNSFSNALCQKPLSIESFVVKDCDATSGLPPILRTRIITNSIDHNTLTLTFCFTDVCCVKYTPNAKLLADSLAIALEPYGAECECTCAKEATITLRGITKVPERFSLQGKLIVYSNEKYVTFPRKFELLGKDTVNQVDEYGMMQGIWTRDTVAIHRYWQYKDNARVKDVVFFPDGKVKSQIDHLPSSHCHYVEFYENGQKWKECFGAVNDVFFDTESSSCKEWNEDGELVYDGRYCK